MAKKSLEQVIKQNKELGFDPAVIEIAYANVNGDSQRIIEEIFRLQQESSAFPTKPGNHQDQDAQLSKAIELSMNEAKDKKISLEPLNPEQRVRKSGIPVGLKNIGNTCYFNSLLQTYFQNAAFVKAILAYQIPKKYVGVKDEQIQKHVQEDFDFKRKWASCKLVENLKHLFVQLIASDRRYIDPTPVISSIVDDYGNEFSIGDQKDIGEFNLIFLSRIEDGLEESRQDRQMEIESFKKKDQFDSPSKINVFGDDKEGSLLRRSSIRINEQSVIAEQFIGKIQNSFINDKENINKTEEELFSLLFVNVKNRQLYKACEEITISHIDDYRNEKGEVIGVEKHSWIKEAPKTLFFQIDRVVYDKATLTPQKINDVFDFPTTFYIDPFLLKNKDQALKIQKAVRHLRNEKEKYISALESIEKYGEKQYNLLNILNQSENFLKIQSEYMQVQREVDNPLYFQDLKNKVDPKFINLLKDYKSGLQQRIKKYKERLVQIEKEIEKAYSAIYSTPYFIYSLLIHEGGADSGHYYSYTYDHQNNKWRKYNDINITEEVEEEVLRLAKGQNMTSAYYLVYAQKEVLLPNDLTGAKMSFKISNEEGYLKDYYSSYLSTEQRSAVTTDNHQMYYDIEQYKMNALATRVVDVYAKKFESFNEIFRKTKIEKKGKIPPVLTSLPIYVRAIDENEYKNLLIEQAIAQYGPKEHSLVFQDQLKKKLGNFNEFKRPKKFFCNGRFQQTFISNVYWAIATRKLFEAIEKEQYCSIFPLLKELLSSDSQDYFNWMTKLLLKIFVVRLLFQTERDIHTQVKKSIEKMKIATIILLKYISNLEDENMLWLNVLVWINELMIGAGEQAQIDEILKIINSKEYKGNFIELQLRNEHQFKDIISSVDLNDALWNASRQENTFINTMLEYRERVKGKFEICNKLYIEMKKYNYPLSKEERDKFLKP